MKKFALISLIVFCTTVFVCTAAKPQKYAVLLATTKSWLFYRHQATLLHAYHTLIENGIPKNNIITMFYDDIANNTRNKEPGVIRNHPNGPNLYENVQKDYTGKLVNAQSFLDVLRGHANNTARGPVLKSGPRDTIFIYMVGLGSLQYITFPTGYGINARDFLAALEDLRKNGKAKKIYVNADLSYSASLFDGLISRDNRIFVSGATHRDELPFAVYCYPEKRICYGSLYGVAWIQHSERIRRLKSGSRKTLFDQFNYVRTQVPYSHVNIYGHLGAGRSKLSEFLDYKFERKPKLERKQTDSVVLNLQEQAMDELEFKMENCENNPDAFKSIEDHSENDEIALNDIHTYGRVLSESDATLMYAEESEVHRTLDQVSSSFTKNNVLKNRNFVEITMENIFQQLRYRNPEVDYDKAGRIGEPLGVEASKHYDTAIKAFSSKCFNMNENTYVLQVIPKLATLCEMGVSINDQVRAMEEVCDMKHRLSRHIH